MKMTETLPYGFSSESTQRELSNEYQGVDGYQNYLGPCTLQTKVVSKHWSWWANLISTLAVDRELA